MRSLRLGFVLISGVLLSFACGKSGHSDRPLASDGAAGGGGSPEGGESAAGASGQATTLVVPPPVACGIQSCKAIVLGGTVVVPCCADPAKGICGADVSELIPAIGCQPLTQEGELDRSCPSSVGAAGGGLSLLPPAPGCCNAATGKCGVWISNLGGLLPFAPGCIDAASLGGGGSPQACGSGAAGGNMSPGSGGAGGESIAAAGASSAAGAPVEDGGGGAGGVGGG